MKQDLILNFYPKENINKDENMVDSEYTTVEEKAPKAIKALEQEIGETMEQMFVRGNNGFSECVCIDCLTVHDPMEPDYKNGLCSECGEESVFAINELIYYIE